MMHMDHAWAYDWCHAQGVGSDPPPLREGGERVGQLMAEAKGITPVEEIVAEAKEEAIEAPSRLGAKLRELEALWERTSTQFFQAPKL
jgi:hypothetical protein